MRIAVCISGMMRNFEEPLIKMNFEKYVDILSPDIFVSTWGDFDEDIIHKNYNNVKYCQIENYQKWLEEQEDEILKYANMPMQNGVNPTSYPQLYKIFTCNELKKKYENENNFKYDVVIRVRPDTLFVDHFNFDNLQPMTITNINFGVIYYPERIYDIFFYGDSESMDILSNSFLDYVKLFDHDFNNGLDKNDACRLLRVQCLINNINIESLDYRICEVYRNKTKPDPDFLKIIKENV